MIRSKDLFFEQMTAGQPDEEPRSRPALTVESDARGHDSEAAADDAVQPQPDDDDNPL